MASNLDLVRSIYADWERGDFSSTEWAHRDIEFVAARELDPGSGTGVAGMREGERRLLEAFEDFRTGAEEFRELDGERVLALVRLTGRGKLSGVELADAGGRGAEVWHLQGGVVTRLHMYFDRDRALADLGLPR